MQQHIVKTCREAHDLEGGVTLESPLAGGFVVKTRLWTCQYVERFHILRNRNLSGRWRGAWFCQVSCLESTFSESPDAQYRWWWEDVKGRRSIGSRGILSFMYCHKSTWCVLASE